MLYMPGNTCILLFVASKGKNPYKSVKARIL